MKQVIVLGHPSYTGVNARAICHSKAQAVRVLRDRGMKRDDARSAVNRQFVRSTGVIAVSSFESVEFAIRSASEGWL